MFRTYSVGPCRPIDEIVYFDLHRDTGSVSNGTTKFNLEKTKPTTISFHDINVFGELSANDLLLVTNIRTLKMQHAKQRKAGKHRQLKRRTAARVVAYAALTAFYYIFLWRRLVIYCAQDLLDGRGRPSNVSHGVA